MTNPDYQSELRKKDEEIAALRDETASLRDETATLRNQLEHALDYVQRLKHWRFGHRTERIDDPGQQVMEELLGSIASDHASDAEPDGNESSGEVTVQAKPKKKGRRRLPSEIYPDLPIDEEIIDLPPEDRFGPDGSPLVPIHREVKEELHYEPATMRIRRVIRIQYGIAATGEKVAIAPPPERIVPGGLFSDETITQIAVHHTIDCLPFNRIAEMMARAGGNVGRQLVTSSFHAFADLVKPLLGAIERDLLQAPLLHVDGSFLFRQDRERKRRCRRSPIYAISDGKQILYRWRPDEKHETASNLLPEYSGFLVHDEWDGWNKLRAGQLTHVGCNSHARRPFARDQKDADAAKMIALYAQLYAIESQAARSGLVGPALYERRRALRQEFSAPIMDQIEAHARDMQKRRTSTMRSAANYILKHRDNLRRFLSDGSLPPDNNLAERVLRRNAMLRNNRRFFVAENGGENLAAIMSLTLSCRLLEIDPLFYLRAILPPLFTHRRAVKAGFDARPDLSPYTPKAIAERIKPAKAAVA